MIQDVVICLIEASNAVDEPHRIRFVLGEEGGKQQVAVILELAQLGVGEHGLGLALDLGPGALSDQLGSHAALKGYQLDEHRQRVSRRTGERCIRRA